MKYVKAGRVWLSRVYNIIIIISILLQVSTAVWLCDGAIVVVDAVEGVCPQVCD